MGIARFARRRFLPSIVRMALTARTRRLAARLAAFATLVAALAPAITSAIAAANDRHALWTVVCTGEGARLVPVPTDAAGVPLAPESHLADHGPFCASHAAGPVLPPPAPLVIPLPAAAGEPAPAQRPFAPRPLLAWAATQPRAPPALS